MNLPVSAERLVLFPDREIESAIQIEIYGDTDQDVLSSIARSVRYRLLEDSRIPSVAIDGNRTEEVTIEVDEGALQRYGLSLSDALAKLRESSLLPEPGSIKGAGSGRILLKPDNQGLFQ